MYFEEIALCLEQTALYLEKYDWNFIWSNIIYTANLI